LPSAPSTPEQHRATQILERHFCKPEAEHERHTAFPLAAMERGGIIGIGAALGCKRLA